MFRVTSFGSKNTAYDFAIESKGAIPKPVMEFFDNIIKNGGWATISVLKKQKWIVIKAVYPPPEVQQAIPHYLQYTGAADRQSCRPNGNPRLRMGIWK